MAETWFPPCVVRRDGDSAETEFVLAADSPWFAGHFPGIPMLPGVGMLALGVHLAAEALGRPVRLRAVRKLRFRGIIRPGERVAYRVAWAEQDGGVQIQLAIRRAGERVGQGTLVVEAG